MIQKEKNYDFRKRMLNIHKEGIRDDSLTANENDFFFEDSITIYISENAGDVILTAAKDFIDYLFTSMGLSAMLKRGKMPSDCKGVEIALASDAGVNLTDGNGYRGYRIETDNNIKIYGFDERGAAQALYRLEDMMNIRHAPFIKKGSIECRPAFSPQMVHSGYGLDEYPNEHLSAITHEGRDAILVFVKEANVTPYGYLDFNELIYRASKYGLDVYAYSYLKSEMHPDDEGAESYYENSYGKLFRKCPGLKGVTLVGESVEFPSKDPHVSPGRCNKTDIDGVPTGKLTAGWYPCMDYPKWLELIKKVVRKYNKDADIVFWTYNWGARPEEARVKLIETLPTDISLQATFEMFHRFEIGDGMQRCADYTLSFPGYGEYFESEAKAAKKRGIRLYSMTNTGGLTWDFGVVPYLPFPYQWMKRYENMRKANKNWGLCGIMESHHYGIYPSFISKLSKRVFEKPFCNMEEALHEILCGEFGDAVASKVNEALKLWSEASPYYIPSNPDQYGAFRIGPSYPFNFFDTYLKPLAEAYSMYGNRIVYPNYNDVTDEAISPSSVRLGAEIESLETMKKLIEEGIGILETIEDKNDNLCYLINMGKFIYRTIITGINAKRWHRLQYETDKAKVSAIVDEMEKLLLYERENAESTIELVQLDSRLGWEPSMEYMTDEEHLRWKLRQVDYILNFKLKDVRKTLTY